MRKLYELVIDESEEAGVYAISLVSEPAMEEDFILFSKQTEGVQFATQDEDKRIVMGAVLVPERKVFRSDDEEGYYVYLGADTIRKVSQKYMKQGNQNNATVEHNFNVDGVTTVESWIVDDPEMDKSKLYNIPTVKGVWMASMKIDNEDVWTDYVKTGKVNGFSIEGLLKPVYTGIDFESHKVLEDLLLEFQKGTK